MSRWEKGYFCRKKIPAGREKRKPVRFADVSWCYEKAGTECFTAAAVSRGADLPERYGPDGMTDNRTELFYGGSSGVA